MRYLVLDFRSNVNPKPYKLVGLTGQSIQPSHPFRCESSSHGLTPSLQSCACPLLLADWYLIFLGSPVQAIQGLQFSQASNKWQVLSGCANVAGLPTIYLQLGAVIVPLSPQQYLRQVWGLWRACFGHAMLPPSATHMSSEFVSCSSLRTFYSCPLIHCRSGPVHVA
jgi:hypothetical protein